MVTPYANVAAPVLEPFRYGLLAAAQVVDDPSAHWPMGVQYTADGCASGGVWDTRCGDPFTVVLTRTAVATQFGVNFTPDVGPYEASIDSGAFAPMLDGAVFVEATSPFVAVFRETGGLGRSVTISGILPGSVQGTTYTGVSSSAAANDPKTAPGLQVITGEGFTVYAGIDCRIVGINDPAGAARRRLTGVEQRLVEGYVWEHMLAVPAAVLPTGSATAVTLKAGIAALEEALGSTYGGIGVIHAPRSFSPYAADRSQIVRDRDKLRTSVDTVWAFGGGYTANTGPDGSPAGAGEQWLYATGVAVVRRRDVFVPADYQSGATNLSLNDAMVIAERQYVVTLDCPLFAVNVDIEAEA